MQEKCCARVGVCPAPALGSAASLLAGDEGLHQKSEQGWGWRCQGCLCQTSVSWGHHFVREGRTSIAGGESEGSSTFYL